jgi:hypothetical protein
MRTDQQRKAIEVYCRELANKFNDAGFDKVHVLTQKQVPVSWTQESIKEDLFKEIMRALYPDKDSTTELETSEVSVVYEHLNKWTSEKFNINLDFPHEQRD